METKVYKNLLMISEDGKDFRFIMCPYSQKLCYNKCKNFNQFKQKIQTGGKKWFQLKKS